MTTTRPIPPRAFSLVEVVVVVVILAVVAGFAMPRVLNAGGRQVRAAAVSTGDLLSVAARREALTSQQVCVTYDEATHQIVLLSLVTESSEGGSPAFWRVDRLAPAVRLGDAVVAAVEADGAAMDPASFRLEFTPGVRRASYKVSLTDARAKEQWTIELPAHADQAVVGPGSGSGLFDHSIDLDAGGAGSAAW